MSSAAYPQTAIRMHLGEGLVLPFIIVGDGEDTDYGDALVTALGTNTATTKTITLEAYTFDCGDSELDDTHRVYGVGATATRIKSSKAKADLADFAKRCFKLTIEASDGEIVRDLEPNDDGEFVLNVVPTAETREEIDEMLGPEGLLVIGTDDNSINRLDGVTPGGQRLGGVIGKIEVRPVDGSPGRTYYGDDLTDTLAAVLGVTGNFVETWGEFEYEDTGSELIIDIADGVTWVNHGYVHATAGGTHARCFRVPAARTVKVFNDGKIAMVGVGGDPITTHGVFIVAAGAKLAINGPTDLSNLGISMSDKATGVVDALNGYAVLVQGAGGQLYLDGNHINGAIRLDSAAFLVIGPNATYNTLSNGGGVVIRGKIYNTDPGAGFLSLIGNSGAVTAAQGGTGQSSYTQGDLLYASSSTTLSKLAKDTNATRVLTNTGTNNNPAWGQVPISNGVSGLGTGVATAAAVNIGSSGSFVVNGGALGTPSSGTLTNATGLPLSTGVTGTLPVANGGTGATTLTGIVKGNGTSAMSAAVAGTDYLKPDVHALVAAWRPQPEVNGRYYTVPAASGLQTNQTFDANVWHAIPVLINTEDWDPNEIALQVQTGQSDKSLRFAIWGTVSDTDLMPGNLIWESGDVSVSSAGVKTATPDEEMPHMVWIGFNHNGDSALNVRSFSLSDFSTTLLGYPSAPYSNGIVTVRITGSYGAAPTTAGTPTVTAAVMPAITLRKN